MQANPNPGPRAALTREIARPVLGSTRSILTGHPADGLTPERLASLLRGAEDGDADAYLELAEQMEERDLHYLSVLGTRKRQVAQLPISVEAASDEPGHVAQAQLVREWLHRDTLETELFDVLDAIGKGYSVTEIIWSTRGGRWLPERLAWRDPRWFAFDQVDGERLYLRGSPAGEGAGRQGRGDNARRAPGLTPLTSYPRKFVVHLHGAKSGLALRGGFARAVGWSYLFKSYALKDWVAFAEIYGLPFRIGKYEPGASDEDIRVLLRAVSNIGSDAAAVMPKSMEVLFEDGKTNGGADVYERLCQYLDRQISKAVLGQTATTDADTGGLGSGEEHGAVRQDIERADARLLAATLQRDLVVPIIDLNFGPQTIYPRLRIGREESHDTAAMAAALGALVPLGLKVGMSTVRDRLGFPDPEPGEDVLAAQAPALPRPGVEIRPLERRNSPARPEAPDAGGMAASALLRPSHFDSVTGWAAAGGAADVLAAAVARTMVARDDAIDAAAAAMASAEGRALLAPLIEPMLEALARGESYEDARRLLDDAAATMDERALEAALERACMVARAAGMSGL